MYGHNSQFNGHQKPCDALNIHNIFGLDYSYGYPISDKNAKNSKSLRIGGTLLQL